MEAGATGRHKESVLCVGDDTQMWFHGYISDFTCLVLRERRGPVNDLRGHFCVICRPSQAPRTSSWSWTSVPLDTPLASTPGPSRARAWPETTADGSRTLRTGAGTPPRSEAWTPSGTGAAEVGGAAPG